MLRPATPLAIIFFVAFVLLLLSTISTPVIKQIPLGSFQGWDFGVLGYCNSSTGKCVGPQIGYSTDGLFSGSNDDGDFSLPSSTRNSLSSILIVHPVAALLTLICFALACAAHFHAPAHSPRYLLALLILTIPTLLVTLLAFLVDILLFVPHVQWGGWIVLAATVLIVASSVVTCAMRRTLVSRKARKKRIAENADMNGPNYYENLNQQRLMADQLPRADSPPPMSGSTAMDSKTAPQFATFEMKRQETNSQDDGRRSTDDRTPLNPVRDPSVRSASTGGGSRRPYMGDDAPPMPMNGRPSADHGPGMGGPRRPSRDEFGNPIPAMMAGGMAGAMAGELPPPRLRHQGSQGSMGSNGSRGRGGAPPYYGRGRGGYGPPPRGGPGRGGFGPPRGGYGPRGGFRGGPPPPGWNGRGRGGYGPQGGMGPGPRGPPPPGYGGDQFYGGPRGPPPMARQPSPAQMPGPDQFVARGPSPSSDLAIGQAIEMDERTGSAPEVQPPQAQPYGLRDSDGDVQGMIGLQQHRQNSNSPLHPSHERASGLTSPTSTYSDNTYVPPRAAWQNQSQNRSPVSPMTHESMTSHIPSSHAVPSTGGFPTPRQGTPQGTPPGGPRHARAGSEPYYEDVDPRFASNEPHMDSGAHPGALMPGANTAYRMPSPTATTQDPQPIPRSPPTINYHSPESPLHPTSTGGGGVVGAPILVPGNTDVHDHSTPDLIDRAGSAEADSSYENLPTGMRSPTGSDTSHFTSVSQRGINPNWRPPQSGGFLGPGSAGAPSTASGMQRRREDVILNANPDFSLPGLRGGRTGRGRGGPTRGTLGPSGLTPQGRYPTEV